MFFFCPGVLHGDGEHLPDSVWAAVLLSHGEHLQQRAGERLLHREQGGVLHRDGAAVLHHLQAAVRHQDGAGVQHRHGYQVRVHSQIFFSHIYT